MIKTKGLGKFKTNTSFGKNVVMIATGTVGAQLIGVLLAPLITRIYTPEEYGIFILYSSLLGMLTVLGTLRYEEAIPIAEDEEKAINVLTLCLIILITLTGGIGLFLLGFKETVLTLFENQLLTNYIHFLPLGIFLSGFYNLLVQWTIRRKNFNLISRTKVTQSFLGNFMKLILGFVEVGAVGLIGGTILGQSGGITTLFAQIWKKERHLFKKISIQKIRWSAKRYKKFPVYGAPSQFLNSAGLQLPTLFITAMYGGHVIGLFGLANNIVNLPMFLIGNAISDVFYGEAASIGKRNPQALKELSMRLFKKLVLLGLLPFLILFLFGPFVFSLVLGTDWYEAGVYARILAVLAFSRLIFTPISRVFHVFERQREGLFLDILRVTLVLILFLISKFFNFTIYMTLIGYAFVMCCVYFATFLMSRKIMNEEIEKNGYNRFIK